MFLLSGVSRFLFVPLAEAVVFAMLASYVLSRTLVPTLAMYWLQKHVPEHEAPPPSNLLLPFQRGVQHRFTAFRDGYHELLATALQHSVAFTAVFMVIGATAFLLLPWLGRDFFPSVDAGQVRLHPRAPSGTGLEGTAR